MAKTGSERVKNYRERRKDHRRIDILIDPETARRLGRMRAKHGESISVIFGRALKSLEKGSGR